MVYGQSKWEIAQVTSGTVGNRWRVSLLGVALTIINTLLVSAVKPVLGRVATPPVEGNTDDWTTANAYESPHR